MRVHACAHSQRAPLAAPTSGPAALGRAANWAGTYGPGRPVRAWTAPHRTRIIAGSWAEGGVSGEYFMARVVDGWTGTDGWAGAAGGRVGWIA